MRKGTRALRSVRKLSAQVEQALRDQLWERLRTAISGIRLNGHPTERLSNSLNVSLPGVRGSAVLDLAPEIAASTGFACHEGGESVSAVLGRSTSHEQIGEAVGVLVRAHAMAGGEGSLF